MVRRACEERDAEGVVPYGCGGKIFRLPNLVVAVGFVFDLFYSIFKLRSGRDIGYYALGLCILKISQCTPTS